METQLSLQRLNQPASYRQNLLEAKAETSIKRHQVKGFINAGEGAGKMSLALNDENAQLAEHLMQLKTSCSGVRLDIRHKELEQYKYRDEASFIANRVRTIHDERHGLQQEIAKMRGIVEEVRDKKVNAGLSTKSYEHILDRMKKDQIRAQIRRNDLERELKRLQKQLADLTSRSYEVKQYEFLANSGVKQAEEELRELQAFRRSTVADMNSILDEKQVLAKKKQQRKEKSDMIKQMAAGDLQDADLIRMKRFLTVQTFLKALLKGKMERLKEFYSPYELAFLKIKSNTSVKDANSLKTEYRNFETSYNQRASWVKHLESQITILEQQKKGLEKDYSQAKTEELEVLEQLEEIHKPETTRINKQLQGKADQCQIMVMSVREWIREQARRMKLEVNSKSQQSLLKDIVQQLIKKQSGPEK